MAVDSWKQSAEGKLLLYQGTTPKTLLIRNYALGGTATDPKGTVKILINDNPGPSLDGNGSSILVNGNEIAIKEGTAKGYGYWELVD